MKQYIVSVLSVQNVLLKKFENLTVKGFTLDWKHSLSIDLRWAGSMLTCVMILIYLFKMMLSEYNNSTTQYEDGS